MRALAAVGCAAYCLHGRAHLAASRALVNLALRDVHP